MEYNIHPDFKMLAAIHPPLNRKTIPVIQKAMGLLYHQQRSSRAVSVERVRIPADSGRTVRALEYIPKGEKTGSCVLYCHGGGARLMNDWFTVEEIDTQTFVGGRTIP